MNAIFMRESIREFLDEEIELEKILRILSAGMHAPSAHNFQPWEFLVVLDKEKKEAISGMSPYAGCAKGSACVIVTMCNQNSIKKDPQWWDQDMSACTQNILLQATEEGIASVWLGFYPDKERVESLKRYFDLPENIIPFSVIALGYTDKAFKIRNANDGIEKIHFNKYE